MALPFIDPTVAMVVLAMVVGLVVYSIWLDSKNPKVVRKIPAYRGKPRVVTKAGIFEVREVIPLSPNKYMVKYEDEGGYSAVYTRFQGFDELIDVYSHQSSLGQGAAVKIELDVAIDIVYGYEDAQTRKMMKHKLAQITESMQKKMNDTKANKLIKELGEITKRLTEKPMLFEGIGEQLAKETNARLKAQNDLLSERGNVEGRINKRIEPIERIASSRAKSRDDANKTRE